MIKDPLNTQETPYDILEIDVNTPMIDIHQALPKFMKKNKVVSKIALAQEAIRKLKNIQDRLSFDITYYSMEVVENTTKDNFFDISGLISGHIEVPISNSSEYIVNIYSDPDAIELPVLNFKTFQIKSIKAYQNQKSIQLLMPFDKIES